MVNFPWRSSVSEDGKPTLPLPQPSLMERALPASIATPDRLNKLHNLSQKLNNRRLWLYLALAAGSIWLVFTLLFFVPGSLKFSVAGQTCAFNPMLLPRLSKHAAGSVYAPEPSGGLSVSGYPLLSFKTCVTPVEAPLPGQEDMTKIALLHLPFLSKNISVKSLDLPAVSAKFSYNQAVSASAQLDFDLAHADTVFSYQIAADDKTAGCAANEETLSCGLEPLDLQQGKAYELKLSRVFAGQPSGDVLMANIETLDPVAVTGSSIAEDTTVYDSPTTIVLNVNKPLRTTGAISLAGSNGSETGSLDAETEDTTLTINLPEPLERKSSYTLRIEQLVAQDGSELSAPFELRFTVSGGPKVSGASIGPSRVPTGANIVINFDIGLKPGQEFGRFARLELGGRAVAAGISAAGNRLTVNPTANLPRCTAFRVVIEPGLVSQHDIGGGEAWTMNSRTLCQSAFSIGRSVQGRAIMAYGFGSGSSRIIFVGGMHGNEKSSVATMNAFINHLEDHPGEIPAHRTIYIIPNHNPDGYARSSRTNANGVDLNRNFPAHDWQSSVQMPGGITAPTGGGHAPLDQPESAALAAFINQQNPRLVLTYHAVARVIISNDAGDSVSLGKKYAADSGYRFTTDAGSDDEFGYATTGEFEDWLGDVRGTPAILVELSSMIANQFSTHRGAMMNMVKLP